MKRTERALQIWQVLIGAAHHRQILTYEMVADITGSGGASVQSQSLGVLMKYCAATGLPPITVLVVYKHEGIPGAGLTTLEELNRDRERVFNHPWYKDRPLRVEDLEPYT